MSTAAALKTDDLQKSRCTPCYSCDGRWLLPPHYKDSSTLNMMTNLIHVMTQAVSDFQK